MKSSLAYQTLFDDVDTVPIFPSTRYQGSKLKFLDWIWNCVKDIPFTTCLDAFGGTGSVAYRFKQEGKAATYNDILPFNYIIGKALIENSHQTLSNSEVESLLSPSTGISYPSFIADTFKDIYFTDEENKWLDIVSTNIRGMKEPYKQAIAYFALFQSCIIKRPYNLFHRKNLYVRTQDVQRSFGNKVTWDTPFEIHFKKFVEEANNAVFDNGSFCKASNLDALHISSKYDLVYIDTPYLNNKGVGVDYADFYHFLNGIVNYTEWKDMIDYKSKHLRLKRRENDWNDKIKILDAFKKLFATYKHSVLVISYRSNGIPTIDELCHILQEQGRSTSVKTSNEMKYALSNSANREVLIISMPKEY